MNITIPRQRQSLLWHIEAMSFMVQTKFPETLYNIKVQRTTGKDDWDGHETHHKPNFVTNFAWFRVHELSVQSCRYRLYTNLPVGFGKLMQFVLVLMLVLCQVALQQWSLEKTFKKTMVSLKALFKLRRNHSKWMHLNIFRVHLWVREPV